MNQLELIKAVKEASLSLKTVHTFTNGDVYELWNNGNIKYGAVNLAIDEIQVNDDIITYSIILYFADRLLQDDENNNNIQLDGSIVLEAVLSLLQDNYPIIVEKPYSFIPFTQQFADYLGGVYVRCNLSIRNSIDLCGLEIEDNGPIIEDLSLSITENGTTKVTAPSNTYYKNVEVDVNVPKGLDVDFSQIYDENTINTITSKMNEDIAYTKSLEAEWNPSNKTAQGLYGGKRTLVYAPNIDISNVTNTVLMFFDCSSLTTIPLYNTSKVTNTNSMFSDCPALKTIPLLNTSNVTSAANMFDNCNSLTTIPLIDTSKVTSVDSIFENCRSLKSIPQLNTSNVENMNRMFYNCQQMTDIPLLDASKVRFTQYMFAACDNLVNFGGLKDLGKGSYYSISLDLYHSTKLTHESLMNVINNIYDINLNTNISASCYLTLGTTNLNKLTADEIAIATNKGWTVK